MGRLSQDGDQLSFAYDRGWRGDPLSNRLPLGEISGDAAVRAWFGELLPEERRRGAFETLTKLSLANIQEYMFWYGEDLPGDISTRPRSEPSGPRDMTRLISRIVKYGESLDLAAFKLSLAGGEPKTAVIAREENGGLRFYAPSAAHPSTHILKASRMFTAIEDYSTALARHCRIFPVLEIRPVAVSGRPVLLIRRFDRFVMEDGRIGKLMQENFCQLCGKTKKYDVDENGVSFADMARAMLEKLSRNDIETFLKMNFFAMLIGNGDDHAGNYAILRKPEGAKIAPAYDVISSMTVKAMALDGGFSVSPALAFLDVKQARKFGQHKDAGRIDAGDVKEMAALFKTTLKTMSGLFRQCVGALKNSFGATDRSQRSVWEKLDIEPELKSEALAALGFMLETVSKRAAELEKSVGGALEQARAKKSRLRF